ncbi:MAG: FRG domain-containing protein [Oxalobacteraceae bacterium]|jgi:hypothetical protein|nr:MAG: FRG domain-containing protein [Oxalobacteraceae bacterium]
MTSYPEPSNRIGADYADIWARTGYQLIASFLTSLAKSPVAGAVYRGQADASWSLMPSASRGRAAGIDDAGRLQGWKDAAARLANPRPTNNFEWLALAQHHGIATTLLDWTYNPLVALFFACGEPNSATGCVWQVGSSAFRQFDKPETIDVFKQDRDLPGLINASNMNARSIAQDSAMSIHPVGAPFTPSSDSGRAIFNIGSQEKYAIRHALRAFGMTEDRLFVDLAVIVKNYRAHLGIAEIMRIGAAAQKQSAAVAGDPTRAS